ncbi:rare lipoprotein A (peptidoglycan hydrolase) [Lewinella aquimaris]|uniref:Rare lipoprotein A (Peptidoglycan hydrolase) n=1 Tax=Neolewinella aquimaris TaxID=1835722 RepID=A0A840E945_9BACT|nr:RlpA-like double-psi beta-barrel domain-containing protein [Neolewinella aquimaris]MBB4078578.1 rare lipoprotein A (peptidoglycan hydrolase) [Neolewinella aquimaris]
MKRLLSLGILVTATAALGAQSFEWNKDKPTPAPHPKEVQHDVQTYERAYAERQTGLAGVYTPDAQGMPTAYGETYSPDEMTTSHAVLPLGTLLRVTNVENGRSVVVRVTDKGRECDQCLVTLSQVAADKLGIGSSAPVSLERSGFSNWNPLPPTDAVTYTPSTYSQTPVLASADDKAASGVVAPPRQQVEKPVANPATSSVMNREVAPTPATFNRYPNSSPSEVASVTPPSPTVPGRQEARGGTALTVLSATVAEGAYAVQLGAYNNQAYAQRRVDELKEQGLTDAFYQPITKADGQVINRVYSGRFANVNEAQTAAKEIENKFNIAGIVAKM